MAKSPLTCLILIAISLSHSNSARILDDVDQSDPPLAPLAASLPSGRLPATTPVPSTTDESLPGPVTDVAPDAPATVATPPIPVPAGPATGATLANPAGPQATPQPAPGDPNTDVAPDTPAIVATSPIPVPAGPATPLATGAATAANPTTSSSSPQLSFYMHDILGGTHPSTRVVTGITARSDVNGIPFSQPNNIFPLQGGVPLTNLNSLLKQNTVPFLTGLNGGAGQQSTTTTIPNNAVNGGNKNNQPFVTAGQLPAGSTLQKLMFGSITVVDDEMTEGEELESGVMGHAQGFYLSSSLDGTSHTVALTLLLQGGDDSISLLGVHRAAAGASHVAVVGGTGKYEGAGGYATVETILKQEDQHTTDGVDTMMHVGVYLS